MSCLQRANEAVDAMDTIVEILARRIIPRGYLPICRVPAREDARWRLFSWARQGPTRRRPTCARLYSLVKLRVNDPIYQVNLREQEPPQTEAKEFLMRCALLLVAE